MVTRYRDIDTVNGLQTKDATPVTILSFDFADGEAGVAELMVIARCEETDAVAGWHKTIVAKRVGGTMSIVGSILDVVNPASIRDTIQTTGWDVTVTFFGSTLLVQVTGASVSTIAWNAALYGPMVTK